MNFNDLTARECERFFGSRHHDAACAMRRLPDARVVWLNERVARDHPRLRHACSSVQDLAQAVLELCAYELVGSTGQDNALGTEVAYADRYGGDGIGTNGGSGRAVLMNGFHIKGVGRTDLIGANSGPSHASGHAYLEEAVREAIFSEIFAFEYPSGAVPIVAIIDTGRSVVWDTNNGPKRESKVLVVRPVCLRPAHFERALLHVTGERWVGARDAQRVRSRLDALLTQTDVAGAVEAVRNWATAWAAQVAYGFAHRIPHAAHSSSNITLGAALIDFGACTSVPSWSRFLLLQNGSFFGEEIKVVAKALRSLIDNVFFSADILLYEGDALASLGRQIDDSFRRALVEETLALCGLSPQQKLSLSAQTRFEDLYAVVSACYAYARKEAYALSTPAPVPKFGFSFAQVYDARPPEHLRELATLLQSVVSGEDISAAHARAAFVGRGRPALYREEMRDRLYLLGDGSGEHIDAGLVTRLIHSEVATGRRHARDLPPDALPLGFVHGPALAAVIFELAGREGMFALVEAGHDHIPDPVPTDCSQGAEVFRVTALAAGAISLSTIQGEVTLQCEHALDNAFRHR